MLGEQGSQVYVIGSLQNGSVFIPKTHTKKQQKPPASEVEEGFLLLCFCLIAQFVASPTGKNTHAADWSSSS